MNWLDLIFAAAISMLIICLITLTGMLLHSYITTGNFPGC